MMMPITDSPREMNIPQTVKKAVYEAYDPSMSEVAILKGRGDLEYPAVLWVKATNLPGWNRCSPVIELNLARKWYGSWSKTHAAVAIIPARQISRTVQLPIY